MTHEELVVIEKSKRDLKKSLVSIGLTPEFPEDINASNMTVDPRPFFDDYYVVMFEGEHRERIYTYTDLYISPNGDFGEFLGADSTERDVRGARADNPDFCAKTVQLVFGFMENLAKEDHARHWSWSHL